MNQSNDLNTIQGMMDHSGIGVHVLFLAIFILFAFLAFRYARQCFVFAGQLPQPKMYAKIIWRVISVGAMAFGLVWVGWAIYTLTRWRGHVL